MDSNEGLSDEQIADLLATVAGAGEVFSGEVRSLARQGGVNQATVDRLARLAEQVRCGARARARLATVDPADLLAGTAVWIERRRPLTANARARASARWSRPGGEQIA